MAVTFSAGSRLIFVTGQIATDGAGNVVCEGDPAGQTRVVFERIEAILSEAGADLSDLVSLTIYLSDLANFDAVSRIRNEIVGSPAPSSTLLEVSALAEKGCLVEISGVAAK